MTMFNLNDDSTPLRAALYARVSTDDQRERQTIDNQVHALREFAPHWNMTIVDNYLDDGISGTIPMNKRPEGARLQVDAKAGKFDVVIFYRLDRLARSLRNFLDIVDFFEAENIGLRSMTETFDTTNPMGRFAIQMVAAVAELERGTILERTRMGRERIATQGKWAGGVVPFGYVVNAEGHLEADWTPRNGQQQSEVEIVQRIFNEIVYDKSTARAIAARLNLEGIPIYRKYQPRGQAEPRYKKRSNGMWWTTDITRLIRAETYKGTHIFKAQGNEIAREVPALVDESTWELAQSQLTANRKLPRSGKNQRYLLAGLIKCSDCGRSYVGAQNSSRKSTWRKFYYRCNAGSSSGSRKPGSPSCNGRSIGVEWLDDLVWDDIRRFAHNPGDVVQQLQERIALEINTAPNAESRKQEIQKSIVSKEAEKDRVLDAYRRGLIDIEALEDQVRRSQAELEPLLAELANIITDDAEIGRNVSRLTDAESLLKELQNKISGDIDYETKKQIVESLVWGVEVKTTGEGHQKQATVEITYAFDANVHAVENGTSDRRQAF